MIYVGQKGFPAATCTLHQISISVSSTKHKVEVRLNSKPMCGTFFDMMMLRKSTENLIGTLCEMSTTALQVTKIRYLTFNPAVFLIF